MSGRRRSQNPGRARRRKGVIVVAGWLLVLLAALSLVTWRQTRGVAMERELRTLESERSLVEAERVSLSRRIEELGSRSRVVRVARERLGMHLPEDDEIVFLPAVIARPPAGAGASVGVGVAGGGR